jgi:hypothetical protein
MGGRCCLLGQPPSPARDGGKPRGGLGGARGVRFRGGGAKMPFVLPIPIRINNQWRICFEWPDGDDGPSNVEITDYH